MRTMRKLQVFLISFILVCVNGTPQKTELDSPLNIQLFRILRNWFYGSFIGKTSAENGSLWAAAKRMKILQTPIPHNIPFPCNVTGGRSSEVPTSIDRLRPGDIDVIGAIGDSLTAGTNMFGSNLMHLFIDNRGTTFTGGGQGTWRQYLTLPNILKEFNPNLIGYALDDSPSYDLANSQFNVAELGARSPDMPFMANELIKRMKYHPKVDIKKHWKLISIFIGHNDFCIEFCDTEDTWSLLKNFKRDMVETIRILRDHLPRTFVVLLPPVHLKHLVDSSVGDRWICHLSRSFECPCLMGLSYMAKRPEYYKIMSEWQKVVEKVAMYPEFQRDDFTVMLQPMTVNSYIPTLENGETDVTYYPSDCFHISQKAHAVLACSLWNNLLERPGNKTRVFTLPPLKRFLCPTSERPYLATWKNSQRINPKEKL